MGVDACDLDSDGDLDLFMTHLTGETNTVYLNDGQGWFEDRTAASGLGGPSKAMTAFGTGCFDYDNDSDLDLYVANGAVNIILSLVKDSDPYPLHQPNQLFANLGDGHFADVSADSGTVFSLSEVSRGVAFGDIDNDGDTDLVVVNNNGPARLLLNQVGNRNPWLGLAPGNDAGQRRPWGLGGGAPRGCALALAAGPCRRQLRQCRRSPTADRARRPAQGHWGDRALAKRAARGPSLRRPSGRYSELREGQGTRSQGHEDAKHRSTVPGARRGNPAWRTARR